MPCLISIIDFSLHRLALCVCVACAVVAQLPSNTAVAVGLTYLDADNGENFALNLAPSSAINTTAVSDDNLWGYRSDGGAAAPGALFKSVFEASGGTTAEDVPEITQMISSLAPNTSYDVYVAYWQGAQAGFDWNVRAGFSSGNLTLFNAKGPNTTFPTAVAGTNAVYHEWEPSAVPTNPVDQMPLVVEAGRTLLLGRAGTTTSSPAGQINVFIDDLPTTVGGPDAGTSSHRSWFEGVAYVPAGTDVFIAPGDFNDDSAIDPADAHIFLVNLHTDVSGLNALQTYRLGDLNADLLINHTDFVAFKDFYDAANGAGALAALMSSVPEPAAVLLLGVGIAPLVALAARNKRRQAYAAVCHAKRTTTVGKQFTSGLLFLFLATMANAAPVTGWVAVNSADGGATAKQLTGANSNSPVLGDGSNNGAGQVALYADINGTIDGAPDIALANGQNLILTGSVNLAGITSSQEQFRWGLFYEAAPPFDAKAWLGYIANNSAGASGGALRAKRADFVDFNNNVFVSTATASSATNLQTAQDGDAFNSGSYDFSMSISRFDNEISIDASLTGTDWSQQWKNALTADPNLVTFDFNRVGFLSGNAMSPDQLTFSNIDVAVTTADALTLQVVTAGPNAGNVQLRNNSAQTYEIDYYEIHSASASLNPAGWVSIDDQEGGDAETVGWDEVPASDDSLLSEINLRSMAAMTPAASFQIGQAFNTGGTQDLRFFYGLTDGTLARGIVQYVSGSLTGDYNGNSTVDAADYVVWRKTLNQNVPNGTGADGDGNGIVEQNDYLLWRANFGETLAPAASLSAGDAVPERTGGSLAALAVLATVGRATARRRKPAPAQRFLYRIAPPWPPEN